MATAKDADVIADLVGLSIHVEAGQILHDTTVKPLVHEGAQDVIDRLRARGYRIEKD